ncbi:MAG: HAD family hydrolase [Alphaproteobacteria bacterium]
MSDGTVRIAMWSGPRNISTALMRAWENRPDTAVWDEPLYAHYLATTDLDHPMREAIVAAYPADWKTITARCAGPAPDGAAVFYQKHMTHHLLDQVGRDWLDGLRHGFLIRAPEEVLASYAAKRESVTAADLGFQQQVDLFDAIADRQGNAPPVFDARDILADPASALAAMCRAFDVAFMPEMLSWPAGRRDSDGLWAAHWYGAVERSTGWQPYRAPIASLPADLARIADACRPAYERLQAHAG